MKQEQKETLKRIIKKAGGAILATALFFVCAGVLYLSRMNWSEGGLAKGREAAPGAASEFPGAVSGKQTGEQLSLENAREQQETDDYWNIAIFGVDSRNGELRSGANADTQMICSINRTTGEIKIVSVYRDTYLYQGTGYGKINSAYAAGGPAQNVMALSENLDLSITDYAAFSFRSAAELINRLGGIDLTVTEAEWEYINAFITETVETTGIPSTHLDGPGRQHLDGVQAVAYSRLRLMDSDMERTKRQQRVVKLVWDKLKAEDSASKILGILTEIMPQISTSIELKDAIKFFADVESVRITGTAGFPFAYTEAKMGEKGHCVIPNTLESNVEQLHTFLFGEEAYACPERVKEIDREILKQAVRN